MTARFALRLRRLLLAGAGLAPLLVAPVPAVGESDARIATRAAQIAQERREEARQPYAMLRTLQSLQERIAHGDIRAMHARLSAATMKRIATAYAEMVLRG